ncbi:MAG: MauE/DoxX family redox-associated membrane protein [Chlamydiota bacterium]
MKKTIERYVPLFVLVLIAILAAMALVYHTKGGLFTWMHFFMGFFLCQFAMLKLFNLSGFVDGFLMYDLIAKKYRGYAYLYPFIELGLGLSYLSFILPPVTYIITLLVMIVGTIGVIKALMQHLDVRCACMGTLLNVPLSTVTLVEDIAMGLMACWMLYIQIT